MLGDKNENVDTMTSEVFYVTDDSPALLCTANNHIEVTFIESIMRANNIPVMKKWRNAGDAAMIYMAVSFTGADIYVPSKLLEKAQELLEPGSDDTNETDEGFAELLEEHSKKRRERAQALLFFIVGIPALFILLAIVFVVIYSI